MRHSCGTLLRDTLVGHSCGTLLWDALVGHSCRTLLWDTLVGHSSYETSSKRHTSSLQNELFVRDLLQKSHVKSPRRAFRTRLPPKITCQVSQTSVSYETFSKSHVSSLQNERFVRDFLKSSHVKVCKTSVSYETSSKTHMSKSAKRAFRTRLPPKVNHRSRTRLYPQTPRVKREHFATHSGKKGLRPKILATTCSSWI